MSVPFPTENPSLLLILSGPAGCGKTTLCEALVASEAGIERAITCTTRPPRPGEVNGEDYYFLTEEEFEKAVVEGSFLEYAGVHGAHYGTLKKEVQRKFVQHMSVVLNIDVQGAASLRAAADTEPLLRGHLVTVFVLPPSLEVLRERLLSRGTDDASSIEQRLINAEREIGQWPQYDYCIRSGSREEDFHQLLSIWTAERRRVTRLLPNRVEIERP